MEKIVCALWRPSAAESGAWAQDLRGPTAHALASAGARGIQVNVADDAVAGALIRMSTFPQPIEGLVSVWVDDARAAAPAIAAVLDPMAERVAGYLVTESVPLAPPPVPPGSRTDGFANLAFLRRPDHLDQKTWLERWQGGHTAVAMGTQSTFGYVQNVVVRPVTPDAPVLHGIVEELFPAAALTDLHVFFDTGGDDHELGRRMTAMTASVAAFSGEDAPLDVVPTSRYVLRTPFAT